MGWQDKAGYSPEELVAKRDQHLADEQRNDTLAAELLLTLPAGHPLVVQAVRRARVAHALAVNVEHARRFPARQKRLA